MPNQMQENTKKKPISSCLRAFAIAFPEARVARRLGSHEDDDAHRAVKHRVSTPEEETFWPICGRKHGFGGLNPTPKTGQRVPRFGDLCTPTFRQNVAVQAERHDSGRN
ncbi:MAG: hypothetical protein DMF92_01805 [Acidobacteria bacterium]|nr:MAG: hypothetical protein DMF92_01805 [Acidobacteriota bacterium]